MQPYVLSNSSFLKAMMNKDLWDLLFYYDKLYVALNATVSSGLLWIHQEDLEGHPWTFCAYPSEMS